MAPLQSAAVNINVHKCLPEALQVKRCKVSARLLIVHKLWTQTKLCQLWESVYLLVFQC